MHSPISPNLSVVKVLTVPPLLKIPIPKTPLKLKKNILLRAPKQLQTLNHVVPHPAHIARSGMIQNSECSDNPSPMTLPVAAFMVSFVEALHLPMALLNRHSLFITSPSMWNPCCTFYFTLTVSHITTSGEYSVVC